MLRTDIKYLETQKKAGNINSATISKFRALPLIAYPLSGRETEAFSVFIAKRRYTNSPVSPIEEYPFKEFIFQGYEDSVAHVVISQDNGDLVLNIKNYNGDRKAASVYSGTVRLSLSEGKIEVELGTDFGSIDKMLKANKLPGLENPMSRDYIKGRMRETLLNVVRRLNLLISYSREKDLYPVIVTARGKTKKKDKSKGLPPIKTGPKVIFLNALPEIKVTDHAEDLPLPKDSTGKRPHARRGFWKTLRSDRFKNHPLYMVPNAIRVRPAWIGDKSKVVDGNIYTVLIRD